MKPLSRILSAGALALLAWLLAGCVSQPLAPPFNLTEGPWVIRQGQAVWTSKPGSLSVTGALVVAMTPDGQTLVQFSTPTEGTLALAQYATNYWQVQFPVQKKSHTGGRTLSDRYLWLQLPEGLLGNTRRETDWIFNRQRDQVFSFHHQVTGERIEGRLVTTHLPTKHVVLPDEHIIRVARRYGLTVEGVRSVNPGPDILWFKPGAVINLPPPPGARGGATP